VERSAKKVAEGSDAIRKYVARVGLNWSLLLGSEASKLEAAWVFFIGGPEPLENEINKILGSKREDRFSDHFPIWYKISVRFVFRTCFASAFSVRPRGTCESSRRSARRQPGVERAPFMVPDLRLPGNLTHPLRNDPI